MAIGHKIFRKKPLPLKKQIAIGPKGEFAFNNSGLRFSPTVVESSLVVGPRRSDIISPAQLKTAEKLLQRIERKGKALSESADRLLRRVS